MGCWTKNEGTPKSSIKNRVFHYFCHPFWGVNTPIFGSTPKSSRSAGYSDLGFCLCLCNLAAGTPGCRCGRVLPVGCTEEASSSFMGMLSSVSRGCPSVNAGFGGIPAPPRRCRNKPPPNGGGGPYCRAVHLMTTLAAFQPSTAPRSPVQRSFQFLVIVAYDQDFS